MTSRALRLLARELRPASGNAIGQRSGTVLSLNMLTGIARVIDSGGVEMSVTFSPDAAPAVNNVVLVSNLGPDYFISTPGVATLSGTTTSVSVPPPPPPPPPPSGQLFPGPDTFPSSTTFPG